MEKAGHHFREMGMPLLRRQIISVCGCSAVRNLLPCASFSLYRSKRSYPVLRELMRICLATFNRLSRSTYRYNSLGSDSIRLAKLIGGSGFFPVYFSYRLPIDFSSLLFSSWLSCSPSETY
jgi:hypothetical protein